MKQPCHRPGPEFEKAADAAEKERQQRIASLSDQQRQEYEALERSHSATEKDQSRTLKRQQERELADRIRAKLAPQPQPRFKMGGLAHAPDKQQLKRMRHSVDDYLAGRKTRDTNAFALQLQNTEKKAKGEFRRETRTALDALRNNHQKERDQFLQRCEKDRSGERTNTAFNKSAKGATWVNAVKTATVHETDHDRHLSKNFDKAR